ncbi:Extended synaptotagmin-2 [Halotydeus destructor]|nr:Extended synaptotagmin-2 [Halotydeus destructor]
MKSFRFDRVDLGSVPFRISSIKTYHENTSREEIIIDMDFNYAGNCDMNISVKGLKAGIKDLHISGTMRIELRPLLKEPPIVGGVSFYFLQEPTIEFNMTNMADILDIPGISDILRKVIRDQLAKMCVLPNKMAFPLSTSVEKRDLKCRPPLGAVRIELFEAKQLRKADVGLLGMGKSDPYCTIAVGEKEFKTPTIKNTISPKWNFACEAIVHFALGQDIKFEVMDEDQGSKDDFLGQASIHLDELMTHGHMEGWLKLEETPTGLIRYRATWMNVESDFDQMLPIQRANSEKVRRKYPKLCDDLDLSLGSVALVCVYVDSAESLPLVKGHEASSYAVLSIGNCAQKTMVKIENASPVFEELFYFLITDPTTESDLRIELLDSKRDDALIGYVSYSMTSLLEAKDHQNFEPLPLRGRATGATFHAFVQLTLLCDCYQNSLPKQVSTIVEEDDAAPGPPSLEDMIFSTVKPMIQISGDSPKKVDASQQPRVTSAGDQDYSTTPDIAGGDQNSNNFPKMKITLTREERLVTLVIHRVVNMTSVEGGKGSERAPDPYVKISCLPGKPKDMERRTAVHRNTRDPVFEETFEFSMDAMKGELVAFEAEVCSKSSGSALSNVFNGRKRHLGTAIIELSDLGSETSVSQWYDIDHDPN